MQAKTFETFIGRAGYARISDALRTDAAGYLYLRLESPLIQRRGLLPDGVLEVFNPLPGFIKQNTFLTVTCQHNFLSSKKMTCEFVN